MKTWLRTAVLAALALIAACNDAPLSGPTAVRWDRDTCERCRMVLSDRQYAAQLRYFPAGERSRLLSFDDFGCAVVWLQDSQWKDDPRTEIWVADHASGEWLDARVATFVPRNATPMAYGLGAQAMADARGMNFTQAVDQIMAVEKSHSRLGGHDHHHPVQGTPEPPPIDIRGDRP